MKNKVMLGSLVHPVKEYCLYSWFENLLKIEDYFSDIVIVDTSSKMDLSKYPLKRRYKQKKISSKNMFSRIGKGREIIFKEFLESDCDYLFILECDIFIDPEVVKTLSKRNKKVVGVPYVMGYFIDPETRLKKDYLTCALGFERRISLTWNELVSGIKEPLKEVNEMGFGCLLLRRDVVEMVSQSFKISDINCDDSLLYETLRRNKIKRFADITLLGNVRHYPHFHMNYCTYDRYLKKHKK